MYRFITSLIVLCSYFVMSSSNADGKGGSVGYGSDGITGSFTIDEASVWPEGQEKPTESADYKNDGIHVYDGTDVSVYKTVCEKGDGLFVEGDNKFACIDKYGKMVPNSNNTKGAEYFTITVNDLPEELRDNDFFVSNYKAHVEGLCRYMACAFQIGENNALECYDKDRAMASASVAFVGDSEYWNNIDPTRTNEYINDGLFELVEKGEAEFEDKCKVAGGVYEETDYAVEPFAMGCLNPDNGKWLPNKGNMEDNGWHSISFDETTPWVLQEHDADDPSSFDDGYIKDWIEYCEGSKWHHVVRDNGATVGCFKDLTEATAINNGGSDDSSTHDQRESDGPVENSSDLNGDASNIVAVMNESTEQKLEAAEKVLVENGCADPDAVDRMTPRDFYERCMTSLSNIAELRSEYDSAYRNEMRLANRLLGGLTMAATGAGGMMLGMGLAEQRADKAAEEQMRAYVSTFKCNYGAGKNVEYGTEPTELPASSELTNLYAEYVALAADLQMRKRALNLRAGIESEPILNAATSGLYDDVSAGRSAGIYTSLARAILDPEGEDAQKWAQQAEKSKNLVISGGVVGGTGAVGGTVGNLLINKDAYGLGKDSDDSK